MAAMEEQPVPGYTIVHKIGEGGQATVYLAERDFDGLRVALKVLERRLRVPARAPGGRRRADQGCEKRRQQQRDDEPRRGAGNAEGWRRGRFHKSKRTIEKSSSSGPSPWSVLACWKRRSRSPGVDDSATKA